MLVGSKSIQLPSFKSKVQTEISTELKIKCPCGTIELKMIQLIIGAEKHMLHLSSIYDALYQLNMTSWHFPFERTWQNSIVEHTEHKEGAQNRTFLIKINVLFSCALIRLRVIFLIINWRTSTARDLFNLTVTAKPTFVHLNYRH